ncbi:MAG: ABC transporter permease [Methanoregulaceae archaeon]
MNPFRSIFTIAVWEVRRSFGAMTRSVFPLAAVLFILLVIVTGFAAQSGMHLQDGMYRIGVDRTATAAIFAGDPRFDIVVTDYQTLSTYRNSFDLIIINGRVYNLPNERSRAAMTTLRQDYSKYVTIVYTEQEDLYAAYPLWIDVQEVKSELSFSATQSGQYISAKPVESAPVPEGTIAEIALPEPTSAVSQEELRASLQQSTSENTQVSRYTSILGQKSSSTTTTIRTPSQLSPPLPFDTIILIFVFIFPMYFTSQFCMMSVMNERIERRGEVLLSMPVPRIAIVLGKILPYFLGMLAIAGALTLWMQADPVIILPLIPVILFFIASALFIGMIARSFKELSFVSIFFSTVATSYLFFPSIFANVHVISLISPLTLIVLTLQGTGFTAMDYVYSTSLFWLTSAVIFWVCIRNFTEERLFSEHGFLTRIREFIASSLPEKNPWLALFLLAALTIPFVFMVQMMLLVLLFNLPMPYSLILLIIAAAFAEELAKSLGIYALVLRSPGWLTWKNLVLASGVVALGFLIGEKLLLLVTLAQITESVFGSILFTSLQVLWMPFLLHFAGILIVGACLKIWGKRGFIPGLILATIVHCIYNLILILGWLQ